MVQILIIFFVLLGTNFGVYSQEAESLFRQVDSLKAIQPSKAIELGEKYLQFAKEQNDVKSQAKANNLLGICYKNQGNFDQSLAYYFKAIELYESINDSVSVSGVHNNLGFVYRLKGDYKNALIYFSKALVIFQKEKKTKNIITVLNHIGSLYFVQNQYEKAKQYFETALDSAQKLNDSDNISHLLNNLGEIYLKTNQERKAKELFLKSLEIKKHQQNPRSKANTYANLAQTYFLLENKDSAEFYLHKAATIFRELNDKNGMNKVQLVRSIFDSKLSKEFKNKNLIQDYHKIMENAKKQGAYPIVQQTLYQLSEEYFQMKQYLFAYQYLMEYTKLKDSLHNQEIIKYISEVEAKFDNERKQERIKALEQENLIQKLEKNQAEQKFYWSVLFAILVVFILLILIWAISKQIKAKRILESKNEIIQQSLEEKEILLKEIHHRVKNNLQIIASLLNLQGSQKNVSAQDLLAQSKDRIYTMAAIHEKLYKSPNLRSINLKDYLQSLMEYFAETYGLAEKNIRIEYKIVDIELNIDQVVPCGLIINELVSNSIKYAFPPELPNKKIEIDAFENGEQIKLLVQDNGKGLPENFSQLKKKSLGFRLIDGLVKQLKGAVHFESHSGTKVSIQFSKQVLET